MERKIKVWAVIWPKKSIGTGMAGPMPELYFCKKMAMLMAARYLGHLAAVYPATLTVHDPRKMPSKSPSKSRASRRSRNLSGIAWCR